MNLGKLLEYKNSSVHIVGLSGAEGTAVLRLLVRLGFTGLTVHDRSSGAEFDRAFRLSHVGLPLKERLELLKWIKGLPLEWHTGDEYLRGVERADLIFLSQGWYLYEENLEVIAPLKRSGKPISSMTDLYFGLSPCPIIGVTGSNGKSTTAKLIDEILSGSRLNHHFAGNDRHNVQVLHEVLDYSPEDLLLLEISNRQLLDLDKAPHIAVVTNIAQDHIAEHGSFEAYVQTKAKIVKNQTEKDFAVLNYDDPRCREIALDSRSQVYFFSTKDDELERGAFVRAGRLYLSEPGKVVSICRKSDLRIPGEHNLANALAAALASYLAGVEISAISRGIKGFKGKELRLQWVGTVGGVDFYNDVKSTTPHATIAALRSLDGPIILIAGGEDKCLDYEELADEMDKVEVVELLPGSGSEKISKALSEISGKSSVPKINECSSLEEAVRHAFGKARPGTSILLSPACASFYSLYMRAPNKGFGTIVRELKEEIDGKSQLPGVCL